VGFTATLLFVAPGAFAADVRFILISSDGLRPDAITPELAPRMSALRDGGARAAYAVNDMPSATMANHATMLTGLVSDVHGLIIDFEIPGTIPQRTLLDLAHDAGYRCAFYVSKSKLKYLAHRESLEIVQTDAGPGTTVSRLLEQITPEGPDVFFLHISEPDSTGHREGWMSPAYLNAVAQVDALVGSVVDAAALDETRPTYILLTSDHGGTGTNHFLNLPEDREIPWILAGPDVPTGRVIEGTVTQADTMPTILAILGVEIPSGLSGEVIAGAIDEAAPAETSDALLPVAPVGIPCILFSAPLALGAFAAARRLSLHRRAA